MDEQLQQELADLRNAAFFNMALYDAAMADAQKLKNRIEELERDLDACRKSNERLRASLLEASEAIEEWGAYADDYFKEKHGLAHDVAYYRDAAMQEEAKP